MAQPTSYSVNAVDPAGTAFKGRLISELHAHRMKAAAINNESTVINLPRVVKVDPDLDTQLFNVQLITSDITFQKKLTVTNNGTDFSAVAAGMRLHLTSSSSLHRSIYSGLEILKLESNVDPEKTQLYRAEFEKLHFGETVVHTTHLELEFVPAIMRPPFNLKTIAPSNVPTDPNLISGSLYTFSLVQAPNETVANSRVFTGRSIETHFQFQGFNRVMSSCGEALIGTTPIYRIY